MVDGSRAEAFAANLRLNVETELIIEMDMLVKRFSDRMALYAVK
jgi:hypothetical protein